MIKKILSIVFSLILIFSLACCADKNGEESASSDVASYEITQNESVSSNVKSEPSLQNSSSPDKTPAKKPQTESSVPTSSENSIPSAPDLSKISCRKASEIKWQSIKVTVKKNKNSFEFKVPSDWSITELSGGGLEITREGKKIGTILAEDTASGQSLDASFAYSEDYSSTVYSYSNWDTKNNNGTLSRQIIFSTYPQNANIELYMILDYNQLDNDAIALISASASVYEAKTEFVPLSKTNGSKRILILGNSFVRTSQIGDFLSAMLSSSQSEYTVEAISINGANVKTFADRSDIMSQIENGEYCYVFQCGFYSDIAVSAFKTINEACEKSGTIPVLFPAHNENPSSVTHAKGQYSDTIFLDWQGEINDFIRSGINRFDFCYDDGNDHSKPLAGYVGAHMIYRNLFGSVPPAEISPNSMTMSSVRYYLGDYIETATVPGIETRPEFIGKHYTISK